MSQNLLSAAVMIGALRDNMPKLGSTVAQWYSAWLETQGLRVQASLASLVVSLNKTHLSLLSAGSNQEDLSQHNLEKYLKPCAAGLELINVAPDQQALRA